MRAREEKRHTRMHKCPREPHTHLLSAVHDQSPPSFGRHPADCTGEASIEVLAGDEAVDEAKVARRIRVVVVVVRLPGQRLRHGV